MSPYSTPQSVPQSSARFPYIRVLTVPVLSVVIAAGSILMIGPQIMFILPVTITAGTILAIRRSFWSAVFFGYPLTFGLISAWIGYKELPGYEQTIGFAIMVVMGLIGCVLIAAGLWISLGKRPAQKIDSFS